VLGGKKPYRERSAQERHGASTGWHEWMCRELLRYLFGLGLLAAIVFVPLQMTFSWLPAGQPPVVNPTLVSILAALAVLGMLVLAAFGYRFLWKDGGWADRVIERHESSLSARAREALPSENSRSR
jgi:hypothetical protein